MNRRSFLTALSLGSGTWRALPAMGFVNLLNLLPDP